ncbi:MAG: hypothetical protein FWF54_09100 [Candidatus Azobacteroides sp.]|nr:hypothetical protein [Candidatus Azobacteroides sp.]
MKRLFKITFICASFIVFTSCLKDKEPVLYLQGEPAIARYAGNQPKIETAFGEFSVAALGDTIHDGDYLWINAVIDYNNQSKAGDITATNFTYKAIGGKAVIVKEGELTDTYNDSIVSAVLYNRYIGKVLFFEFTHKASENQTYDYELICNTDSLAGEKNIPILYLKNKKINTPTGDLTTITTRFAIDMTDAIPKIRVSDNEVLLYMRYKTGTRNGEDVYASFKNYPLSWPLKSDQ